MNVEPISVLVVEDDPGSSEIHRRFTEKVEGFKVIGIANDLANAEEMVEILKPQLILLDLHFPEGSGMDLLWKIRARHQETDFILITAAREIARLKEAMRGGAFDYIIKPVVFARFKESLGKYRDHLGHLAAAASLEQRDVDRLLHVAPAPATREAGLPKGIDPLTLEKVRRIFAGPGGKGVCAEELGTLVGISRPTARRYLEHLVATGFLHADLVYGTVGRPERRYFRS